MRIYAALLFLVLAAPAAADDCAKNSDACSAGQRKLSPFLEAVRAVESSAAPKAAPAPVKPRAKLPPASAPVRVEVSSAPAAPQPAPESGASSPVWLLFVGGSLAGLYFYLNGGRRKGKRK